MSAPSKPPATHSDSSSQSPRSRASSSPSSSQPDSQQPSLSVRFDPQPHHDLSLQLLHEQIRQLKLENSRLKAETTKDRYRAEVHLLRDSLLQKQREIQTLKQQLSNPDYRLPPSPRTNPHPHKPTKNSRKPSITSSEEETDHFHAQFSSKPLLAQLKQEKQHLQSTLTEMQRKMEGYEHELRWLASLSCKVISTATKLGYLFKEKTLETQWTPRRQAKAAWRYLKHVLHHLLKVELPEK